MSGFATYSRKDVTVNVAQTTDINIELKLAGVSESVNVTAEQPMVKTTDSSVGGVVDVTKIESLPLNGRQFADLAVTIPGVGLGFHSDPTKSTQYSPQIAGGNGRNVNYQIDGGDNRRHRRRPAAALPARGHPGSTHHAAARPVGRSNGGG